MNPLAYGDTPTDVRSNTRVSVLNEQAILLDGELCVARPSSGLSCEGCVLREGYVCRGNKESLPPCSDSLAIIWVKVKEIVPAQC